MKKKGVMKKKKTDMISLKITGVPYAIDKRIRERAKELDITPEEWILNALNVKVENAEIEDLFEPCLKSMSDTFSIMNLLNSCFKRGYKKIYDKLPIEEKVKVVRYCLQRIELNHRILAVRYERKI